jgi:hypothetical protein
LGKAASTLHPAQAVEEISQAAQETETVGLPTTLQMDQDGQLAKRLKPAGLHRHAK